MVEEKIGWMVSYLFGLESMAYLTTGLIDAGIEDYSLESAIAKISGTEFVWYQANRALQLAGGLGYMRDQPYEQILRDIRIFPIFEGANDVMRSFVALSALKPLGEELEGLGDLELSDPIGSIGALADYAFGRVKRELLPDRLTRAHEELSSLADSVGDQVKRLRGEGESLLRAHGKRIVDHGLAHKRYCDALSDIYAQIAVLSRVTAIFEEQGVEASGQERFIAETFCRRAGKRVDSALNGLDRNDDDRMHSIAALAYKRGAYGYALFED
jgi:acyl-CoA dehydrogenase family member 9